MSLFRLLQLTEFFFNLRVGFRLATFRKVNLTDFYITVDQALYLILLDIILSITINYIQVGSESYFNFYALPYETFALFLSFIALYLIAKIHSKTEIILNATIIIFSALPLTYGLLSISALIEYNNLIYFIWLIFVMRIIYISFKIAFDRKMINTVISFILFTGITFWPLYFIQPEEFWIKNDNELHADINQIKVEDVFYSQIKLIEEQKAELLPERPGIIDLYFVGFAGDSNQDVFMKEVKYVYKLFNERFETSGRSAILINNNKTVNKTPMASSTNLSMILNQVGKIMNPEEDILFLFLTMHGSEFHELNVNFWPLQLNSISPEDLQTKLKESGIKWKVIVISACYSGGFIEPLKDDYTLIITSAKADRTSFGCGKESDLTYFGKALFEEQLNVKYSFTESFYAAIDQIAQREKKERLKPSVPQMHTTTYIEERLKKFEAQLIKQ